MAKKSKKKNKISPAASGLAISRSYGKFTCSWKPSYGDAVQWQYATRTSSKWPKLKTASLAKKTTSRAVSYDRAKYVPITTTYLRAVGFKVRGTLSDTKKVNYTISKWPKSLKTFTLKAPYKPTISFERTSATRTVFTGSLRGHFNNGVYWGTYVQFATILRINKNDTGDPASVKWNYGTKDTAAEKWSYTRWVDRPIYDAVSKSDRTSFTYTVDDTANTALIQNAKNAVRWVAFRVAGPGGYSPWTYARVAYGAPYAANVTKGTIKKNSQRGLDCTVEWTFQHSLSFPIDNMTVQYAMAAPGGIYTEYVHTDDIEVEAGKSYYTLTATYVPGPTPDNVANYYNRVESEYYPTSDEEPEEGKTYYTVTSVLNPVQADINNYYINIDGVYEKTTDLIVDETKTYYTVSVVSTPSPASMDSYYEKTVQYYVKTTDKTIDNFKKYYTIVASPVVATIEDNLDLYYELIKTNFVGPVEPNWQDANIGGDNTVTTSWLSNKNLKTDTAKVSFKIDSELPNDQMLYVRINTTHDNKTTNGAYYMCTDDGKGTIADKDILISEPSFSEPVVPGSDNFISFSATNNSEASGIRIAVVFLPPEGEDNDNTKIIGVLEPSQSEEAPGTIEIPPEYTTKNYGIGIYAFIGQYGLSSRIEEDNLGYNLYVVTPIVRSKLVTYGGEIPLPATNVQANHIGDGNVLVTWDWNWETADSAEIAWSDYPDALISNEQPSTYEVPNSKNNRLIVRNLELGKTWYFWVRLHKEDNISVWSSVAFESLSSSPSIPTLSLSKRYINVGEKFTASWSYVSADGSSQESADICLCTIDANNSITYSAPIAQIPNENNPNREAQYIVIDPFTEEFDWHEGEDYNLAVQVTSSSGMVSEKWSDPVPISVIEPIDSNIISTSLTPQATEYDPTATYAIDDYVLKRDGDTLSLYKCVETISEPEEWNSEHWTMDEDYPCQELTTLSPAMTLEAIPSKDDGEITVLIERSRDYYVDRPDEGTYGGNAGDVVARMVEEEENVFSLTQEDLTGYLDDGAYYNYVIRTEDSYGQVSEIKSEFVVRWEHQALMPNASITLDTDNNVPLIHINEPEEIPAGYDLTNDTCDIYRKSADGYEMLFSGATFNETYVDPYPTIGDHGGYRVVYKTYNGDYITDDGFAWVDLDDDDFLIESESHIIDFGSDSVELMFNVSIDNSWKKDFQETKYLGGSIQGDWNTAISKTTSISVNVPTYEWSVVEAMRNLASYNGECHVRTKDGANFLANIEVSERYPYEVYYMPDTETTHLCSYTLSITRLDPIEPDGMSLEDWINSLPSVEEPSGD